ncbi:DUF4129 domain-containing protein [Psychromicrobium xiongbiense]|uniref:DUF4129 domain-containing protein n=1 Tax=Psychromicrobium xiongbiense TaxID=3051184 RepID=UPI0025530103|nr:DUF4129 domain-containing protein [Psychromicrobium sp. YIM S02556]
MSGVACVPFPVTALSSLWHAPNGSWDVPVSPDAEQARRWASEELAKRAYQDAKPGWLEAAGKSFTDFLQWLAEHVTGIGNINPGLIMLAILILAGIAVTAVVLIVRPRLRSAAHTEEGIFEGGDAADAARHRTRAAEAAAAGDFDTAVIELFRAMIRATAERTIFDPEPGMTASEGAAKLSTAFPSDAASLGWAGELFNRVRYSRHRADRTVAAAGDYERMRSLDATLVASRPSEFSGASLNWVSPA